MSAVNWWLLVSFASLLVTALPSCLPAKPTEEEMVGLWVERRSRSQVQGDFACAYFRFAEDGRFEAHNLPNEYFVGLSYPLEHLAVVEAQGTWALDTQSKDPFALHRVLLRFGPMPPYPIGYDDHLYITYPPERVLLAGVPDTPTLTFYKREDIQCK